MLREVAGESTKVTGILENTTAMLNEQGDMPVISAPIIFAEENSELKELVGILKTKVEVGACKDPTLEGEAILS